jgi:hypothetical protein
MNWANKNERESLGCRAIGAMAVNRWLRSPRRRDLSSVAQSNFSNNKASVAQIHLFCPFSLFV